jgi:hypothetical protein
MKINIILMAIAAGAIMRITAVAEPLDVEKTAQSGAKPDSNAKPETMTALPLVWKSSAVVNNAQIMRAGNLSSRSWTTTTGWDPGIPSIHSENPVPKLEGLPIFWFGHEPWR